MHTDRSLFPISKKRVQIRMAPAQTNMPSKLHGVRKNAESFEIRKNI